MGKAGFEKTALDITKKHGINDKVLFGVSRQNASGVSATSSIGTGGGSSIAPVAGFLEIKGGSMIGPFALGLLATGSALNITIDGSSRGHFDVSPTKAYSSNTYIFPASGFSGNLSWIDNAQFDGQILKLRILTTYTINILSGNGSTTGNIFFPNGFTSPYAAVGESIVTLMFSTSLGPSGMWIIDSISPSSTITGANKTLSNLTSPTAINQDLICGDGLSASQRHNIVNLNILDFGVGSGSSAANHPYIVGNGTNHQFNIGAHATDIITLTNAFNSGSGIPDNGVLQLFGTSHGVHSGVLWIPSIKTVNTSSVISSGDFIGGYYFDAFNSAFTQKTFASVFAKADVITSGSERGSLRFNILIGTTLTEEMFIDQGGINMNSVAILASGLEIDGGNILLNDGVNIFTGTSTGTKIGFSTSEKIGFWGKTPVIRQTVTGSRGGNAALQSLLSALNTAGIVTDASSA